jgi:hypothetical protein
MNIDDIKTIGIIGAGNCYPHLLYSYAHLYVKCARGTHDDITGFDGL